MIEILKIIEVYDHAGFYAMEFRVRTANGKQFLKATFDVHPGGLIDIASMRVFDDSLRIRYEGWKYARAICDHLRLNEKRILDYVQTTIQQKLIP